MGTYSMDVAASFTEKHGPISALAAYNDSTSVVIDMRSMNDKVVFVKEVGGSAGITFKILASIDSNPDTIEYDITHLGDTAVGASGSSLQKFSDLYTFIKIQVKGAGGIAVIKVAGAGN